jgi:hypothetical protein
LMDPFEVNANSLPDVVPGHRLRPRHAAD